MIVFLNKIDVLDEKIRAGQRIYRLHSAASTWLGSHELRKCELSMFSLHESPEVNPLHLVMPERECPPIRTRRTRTFNMTNDTGTGVKSPTFMKTSIDGSCVGIPIMENGTLYDLDALAANTKQHSSDGNSMQFSLRASISSFNRGLRALSPMNSVRRFRRSFRQASLLPVPMLPDSCGLTSRVSCTFLVARLILSNPYRTFIPSSKCDYGWNM